MIFYRDFAASYGTIWIILLITSVVMQQNVNAGEFGFVGFPIISLVYAIIARNRRLPKTQRPNSEFNIFLEMNPAYKYLPVDDQVIAFSNWRDQMRMNAKKRND